MSKSETSGKRRRLLGLAGWLAVVLSASLAGALFLPGEWYARLQKPAWTAPDAVFAPVWGVLYALMAIAAWMVWLRPDSAKRTLALVLFLVQLGFNAVWSWLFFGLHWPGLAFLDLALLWLTLSGTILVFWRVRVSAAVLLLPYWLWIGYAGILNLALWQMNRSATP